MFVEIQTRIIRDNGRHAYATLPTMSMSADDQPDYTVDEMLTEVCALLCDNQVCASKDDSYKTCDVAAIEDIAREQHVRSNTKVHHTRRLHERDCVFGLVAASEEHKMRCRHATTSIRSTFGDCNACVAC